MLEAAATSAATPATLDAPSAAVLPLPLTALARFRRLMNYEGWDVDLARLCVDTRYAYACMATAHSSGDERLRQAALALFDAYDRNAAAGPVH